MNKIYYCYPGGKHKVLTMSYDDGKQEDRKLLEIFNQYGIKGTFHLNYGLMDQEVRINKVEIASLYEGHEVAAHTYTHPTIARCPDTLFAKEDGIVKFERMGRDKKKVSVYPVSVEEIAE